METTVFYLLIPQKYINSKQKNSEIKPFRLCLGNISKDFKDSNLKKIRIKLLLVRFFR